MSQPQFIHLCVHSEYSVLDGVVRLETLIQKAKECHHPAIALTDRMNLFAAIKFYKAAREEGLKAILGCDVWIENPKDPSKPFSSTFLCENATGYHHLIKLISKAYQENQPQGIPQIKLSWLQEHHEGLLVLSGIASDVGQAFLQQDENEIMKSVSYWKTLFPSSFYLSLQRIGEKEESLYESIALPFALKHQLPIVAINGVCFLEETEYSIHEVRVCIHRGELMADGKRPRLYTPQQYYRSTLQMQQLFSDVPEALENSVEIAKRCNVELNLGEYRLPLFPTPPGMTLQDYFTQKAETGLKQRLNRLLNEEDPEYEVKKEKYETRLKTELDVLVSMGFAGYFLIVADFIEWSKAQEIPVGPGRGSGAGSLVAYALGITGLDPLAYDLLFERFLNPERISMPDFDIDFCMEGRDRVIEYVAERYGRDSVSQIITFGTMAAKAAIRDVGRVLGYPYSFVDSLAKLIPFELGMTLDKAMAQEEVLKTRYQQEEEVRDIVDKARAVEGLIRNVGKHAGGVVIAPSALTDFTPLYCEPNSPHYLTQFDKDDDEAVGLVKFDFLGLRTLTILHWALKTIEKTKGIQIDLETIPLNDAKVYESLQKCETTAVFQLESRGMKDLIKRLQPDCFEDIIALVALFRPGPLQSGMVDDFIHRKHGLATVEYPHPELQPILSPTYGVILYQEQVMQIAQVLAGYTLGGADLLRRAMGKKKPEEMAKQRQIFTEGAKARHVDEGVATFIFDLMEKFAGYGFNKSHSAAYALVAYQTAWLKVHYPSEFMAAVLSSDMDNTDKVVVFLEEAARMGLTVKNPHIHEGEYFFTVNPKGDILYGLGAIKGVGQMAVEALMLERETRGPFLNLFDFCQRVDLKKINRKVLEALIKSGAMDCFHESRAVLWGSLNVALKHAEQETRNQQSGQMDLFSEKAISSASYVEASPWSPTLRLQYEKESLGCYLSGHPMDIYGEEVQGFCKTTLKNISPTYEQSTQIAGQIIGVRSLLTKKGDRMAIITLDDGTGRIDAAIFSNLYQTRRELLVKEAIVVVEGEVSVDDYTGGYRMSVRDILSLEEARVRYGRHILLSLSKETSMEILLSYLKALPQRAQEETCPIHVEYFSQGAKAKLRLGPTYRLYPSDEQLDSLRKTCDIGVRMVYPLKIPVFE